jgi:chromosome segregation ATPase
MTGDGTELERRVHAALDRIAAAADAMIQPAGEPDEDLVAALEAEREANLQLEERVKAIKERQESLVARLERDVADLKAAMASRDTTIQTVRKMNGKLRRSNRALRSANAEGLADANLVNEALAAEAEALRALVDADRAELDEIISTLEPIVKEVSHG